MIDFMREVLEIDRIDPQRPLQDFVRRKFAKEIKGLAFTYIHVLYTCTVYMYCIHVCPCTTVMYGIVHPEGTSINAYAMHARELSLTKCTDLIKRACNIVFSMH